MDLFVPALASNPCADKAHCAGKAGRLAKQGNAGSARIWGQRGDEQVHDTLQTLSDNRASPDRQKVVHAYREIAAGAPRSPHRFSSSPYRGFGHMLSEPWQDRLF